MNIEGTIQITTGQFTLDVYLDQGNVELKRTGSKFMIIDVAAIDDIVYALQKAKTLITLAQDGQIDSSQGTAPIGVAGSALIGGFRAKTSQS